MICNKKERLDLTNVLNFAKLLRVWASLVLSEVDLLLCKVHSKNHLT